MTKLSRGKQTNCQSEPSYSHHETVVFSIRNPDYYMGKDCIARKWNDLEKIDSKAVCNAPLNSGRESTQ